MTDQVDRTLGQIAFEAYCVGVGGLTFDGKPIPGWNELHGDKLKVQGGWEAAAEAIRQHTRIMASLERAEADRAAGYRSHRDGQRPLKSHAQPLSYFLPEGGAQSTAYVREGASFKPLPPVDDDRAERARESVPVETDDDTRDDAQ